MLDGAVGGDIPGEDNPSLGDVDEGSEGVDAWRPPSPVRPRFTKYDNGGGGARGPSSSVRSYDWEGSLPLELCCFEEPVTMPQILANPFFFFFVFSGTC